MKIVYFGNNRLGWDVLQYLREEGEQIAALVLQPPATSKFRDEIRRTVDLEPVDASSLRDPDVVAKLRELQPEIGVSVLFGYILAPELIDVFPFGIVNLHPSLLPYNRGAAPNVWSIVDGTPAGVTLHYIDSRIDTGDVIAQQQVAVEPVDTGASLYEKLETTGLDLFRRTWPLLRQKSAPRIPQPSSAGTFHRSRDIDTLNEIHLDRLYTGRELLDILRARTFRPYPGAFFRAGGRRVQVRLELEYTDAANDHD